MSVMRPLCVKLLLNYKRFLTIRKQRPLWPAKSEKNGGLYYRNVNSPA